LQVSSKDNTNIEGMYESTYKFLNHVRGVL